MNVCMVDLGYLEKDLFWCGKLVIYSRCRVVARGIIREKSLVGVSRQVFIHSHTLSYSG